MSDNVTIDDRAVLALFERLSPENLTKITADALRATGTRFAEYVQANVDASPIGGKKATRTDVDSYKGEMSVSIVTKTNLLARIFEGGTYKASAQGGRFALTRKGKQLSKPANRGNIRGYYFLGQAFEQHGNEIPDDFARIFAQKINGV